MLLAEIMPWVAKRLEVHTPPGMWAFNPSIVRYRGRTLCSVRLANYHMPGARPSPDNPPRPISRCVMLELDDQLEIVHQDEIEEGDFGSREADRSDAKRLSKGFEDYRLFTVIRSDLVGALYASASSACTCPANMAVIEISYLELEEYASSSVGKLEESSSGSRSSSEQGERWAIAAATPLRGEWSRAHQKNWMPFVDHPSGEPRWLYSVDRGGLHGLDGRLEPTTASPNDLVDAVDVPTPKLLAKFSPAGVSRRTPAGARNSEVTVFSRRGVPRPSAAPKVHGRVEHPLRGGTQLVRVPDSKTWIGLAHGYRADGERKFYWHAWIAVDERGTLRGVSAPFKLCDAGIEFAAGLVIDAHSRQVAVSYGVDDDSAWIGVGQLGDALGMLPKGAIV